MPVPEAKLEQAGGGLVPAADGWFVVNVADAQGMRNERAGTYVGFEGELRFPDFGISVHVLEPGQANGLYHSESVQEGFLVLYGECLVLIEGQERTLRAWDFVHCPPGTRHIFVGAGDGPCAILMVGARTDDEQVLFLKSELAARYGASAEETTPDPKQAYARFERDERGHPASWDRLPWA